MWHVMIGPRGTPLVLFSFTKWRDQCQTKKNAGINAKIGWKCRD